MAKATATTSSIAVEVLHKLEIGVSDLLGVLFTAEESDPGEGRVLIVPKEVTFTVRFNPFGQSRSDLFETNNHDGEDGGSFRQSSDAKDKVI